MNKPSQQHWKPAKNVIGTVKTTFYNLVLMHDLDQPTLQTIANMAKVDIGVVNAMFTTVAVYRVDAEKVLIAFSEYTGKPYTLENVRVALHPTFKDIVDTHQLDGATLSTGSGVPITFIDMMLCDEPVPIKEARLVLQIASRLSGQNYTLENVDVKVEEV